MTSLSLEYCIELIIMMYYSSCNLCIPNTKNLIKYFPPDTSINVVFSHV